MWQSRQWRKLLNLIDHLPQNTHFHHALMQDEGYAKFLAKMRDEGKADAKAAPRWEVWSSEREGLARVEDAVKQLSHSIVAAFGGKPGEFKFVVRPASKIDAAAAKTKSEEHKKLASRFIAGRKRL